MSLFKTVDLIKISKLGGEYIKGKWVEGEKTETAFKGTFQPAKGQDLETLPQGKRNSEVYVCYAPIELEFTCYDSEKNLEGDLIQWEDKLFEIITCGKWNNSLIVHWKLVCSRKKEGEK